jgi:hypothetical protein
MGLSVLAFALIAVQRAGSAQRTDPVPTPPATDPGEDGEGVAGAASPADRTGVGGGSGDPARGPAAPAGP